MASKQTEELNKLYREWVAALQANPEMPLDERRHISEQWERITGEPGGVDYIETDAGGFRPCGQCPKAARRTVLYCAPMAAGTWSVRCIRTASSTPMWQRR